MNNEKIESTPNDYKRVKIQIGAGKNIFKLFAGNYPEEKYFAPGVLDNLFLDEETGVSLSVTSEYVAVLEEMMKKFKDSTIGTAIGLIQKMSDLASGFDIKSLADQVGKDKSKAAGAFANLKALPANVRYQTKYQSLPAWKSTGPIELGSFTFRFYLGMAGKYDGRTEVYNPALAFSKVNQPSQLSSGVLQGPLPNTAWVYGVIGNALGNSIVNVIKNEGVPVLSNQVTTANEKPDPAKYKKGSSGGAPIDYTGKETTNPAYQAALQNYTSKASTATPSNISAQVTSSIESGLNTLMGAFEKTLNKAIEDWPGTGLVQITIGQFALPKMTVKDTKVEFSYDTDDKGYPIWAKVIWSGCKTLEIATIQQMPLHLEGGYGKEFIEDRENITPAKSEVAAVNAMTSDEANNANKNLGSSYKALQG